MCRAVLYQASGYWYWYLLDMNTPFNLLLTPDGRDKNIRKALVHARETAIERGLSILSVNIERD